MMTTVTTPVPRITSIASALFALGLAACHSSAPKAPAAAMAGGGAGEATTDVSAWLQWEKVSAARFRFAGHGGKWVDVYVEPAYAEAYRTGGPAPVGIRIVKAGYADEAGTQFQALTVMAKMPAGYDSDGGDWYYGVLDRGGRTAMQQGKLAMCRDCHATADVDYRFGLPQ